MKRTIVIFLLFISFRAIAQDYTQTVPKDQYNPQQVATGYKTHGYINGKRLDSIEAQFAQFDWRTVDQVTFDYGQHVVKNKEYVITDNKGVPLLFAIHSFAFLLNFFHYNNWDLAEAYSTAGTPTWIVKKRD